MNQSVSRIVCAAMLMKDGSIIVGIRHFSPEMRVTMEKIYGKQYHLQVKGQGFVDQFGIFFSRLDAWKIADNAGQIIRSLGWTDEPAPRRAKVGDTNVLFSENLY
jgi:hypothetical protein